MRLLIPWNLFGRRSVQPPFFHSPVDTRRTGTLCSADAPGLILVEARRKTNLRDAGADPRRQAARRTSNPRKSCDANNFSYLALGQKEDEASGDIGARPNPNLPAELQGRYCRLQRHHKGDDVAFLLVGEEFLEGRHSAAALVDVL